MAASCRRRGAFSCAAAQDGGGTGCSFQKMHTVRNEKLPQEVRDFLQKLPEQLWKGRAFRQVDDQCLLLPEGVDLPDGLRVETRKVSAIEGDELVSRVAFAEGESLRVSGVFIAYGTAGSGDFARKLGAQLDGTRIKANADGSTAVPGLFAAGDCTGGLLQVAKAVADGAEAAMSAVKFVRK